MPTKQKRSYKKVATNEKQATNAISGEQGVQKNILPSSSEPSDPDELQEQRTLARGDYNLVLEKVHQRLMRKLDGQHDRIMRGMETLLAKMQGMQEMGEIYRQVGKRLKDGEWDKCRGLPREQQREILSQIYGEELVVRMQQDVFNKTTANWDEHRFRRIELIKWSKLPDSDKEKWLEFYNKPSPNNLNEGDEDASETQEHPQESQPWPA
jgi:hypothetical protein